ncbi:MAG: hypothetical protein Q4D63_02045 [Neisseria animaloris]|nr:hypothetical protein [Neisseria animaloris]
MNEIEQATFEAVTASIDAIDPVHKADLMTDIVEKLPSEKVRLAVSSATELYEWEKAFWVYAEIENPAVKITVGIICQMIDGEAVPHSGDIEVFIDLKKTYLTFDTGILQSIDDNTLSNRAIHLIIEKYLWQKTDVMHRLYQAVQDESETIKAIEQFKQENPTHP